MGSILRPLIAGPRAACWGMRQRQGSRGPEAALSQLPLLLWRTGGRLDVPLRLLVPVRNGWHPRRQQSGAAACCHLWGAGSPTLNQPPEIQKGSSPIPGGGFAVFFWIEEEPEN